MAFVSGDDSHPVCLRIDTGLQTCHFAILIKEGNVFLSVDSGLCLAAGRTHVFDVRTKRHGREIEGIDPDVQQSSSGQFRTDDPLLVLNDISQIGREGIGFSDSSLFDQFPYFLRQGHVAGPYGFRNEHLMLFGQVQQVFGLTGIGGKRLLAKNRLLIQDAKSGVLIMLRVRCRYIDKVDMGILDQFLIRTVCFGELPFKCFCFLFGPGSDGIAFYMFHPSQGQGHFLRDIAAADNTYFIRFHCLSI